MRVRKLYKIISYEYADGDTKQFRGSNAVLIFVLGIFRKKVYCLKVTDIKPDKFFRWLKTIMFKNLKESDFDNLKWLENLTPKADKAGTKLYYDTLEQAHQQGTSPELDAMLEGMDSDYHGTWKEFDELSEADKKLVKAQIDHQIKEIVESQKNMGSVPNELKDYINSLFEITPPSYDWKTYLRRFSSTSTKTYTKKTRRKLNKRYEENPALKIKTKKHILVGVDTSGSVSEKDLHEFFNEIYHIHKTGVQVTVAEGDANVQNVYEYKGKMPNFVKGRGGTDMNPFVEYVNKHKEYSNLIILTDGFIPERSVNTFKPLLTVVCSSGEKLETVKEGGWINTIKIQK
jgi:predicted metal-dependent peptidase